MKQYKKLILFAWLIPFAYHASAQTALITGIDKSHTPKEMRVTVWHPTFDGFYRPPAPLATAVYTNDSVFTITIPLEMPVSADLQIPDLLFFRQCWVSPGDTVHLTIGRTAADPIRLSGSSAFHYNIYQEVSQLERAFYQTPVAGLDDLWTASEKLETVVDSLLADAKARGTVHPEFVGLFGEERKARELFRVNGLFSKIKHQLSDAEIRSAQARLQQLSRSLQNPLLLSSRYFALALTTGTALFIPDTLSIWERYDHELRFITENYEGKIMDYLLGEMAVRPVRANQVHTEADRKRYNTVTSETAALITDPVYRQWSLDYLDFVNKIDQPLPDRIRGAEVLTNDGTVTTFDKVLDRSKGRFVLLDVWATWCAPCLQELKLAQQVHEKYKDAEIDFAYLSLDNPNAYGKMRQLTAGLGIAADNYILADAASPLYAYLNLRSGTGIPRYLLFDREGKLKSLEMPRPSTPQFDSILRGFMNPAAVITIDL